MKGTSWLLRTASAFAQIERSIKAVPVQPGALYPPQQRQSSYPINWPGWPEWERENQHQGRQDLANAKIATTSPWVFADVQAIANEFSTADLVMKERVGDKLEDVDNHSLEQLWESPNEHMGRSFVTAFWAWSYVLSSKAYLYWVPDTLGREPMEVWPIPPFMIRPLPDRKDFISGYAFKSSQEGDALFIPSEYITYSHSVNLFDARDGLSFLVAAMTEIKADLAASQWNLNFFDENNGLPDGLVGLDPSALDQDVERVRMELKDFFGGTKRGIAVARSNDLKYTQFGRSQKDMEFQAGREFASKVIGRTLGFPDGYWSDLANRANAEQARKTMISGAVWPLLVRLSEDMNAKRRGVVQRWYGEQYRAEFKDIRPEDKEAKRAELAAYQPFYTLNELRELTGQEAFDDVRGLMLVAEITKGAPLPGTPAAQQLEDEAAAKMEAEAQSLAASGAVTEEEAAPAEPPPPVLGYHIEQGVVSRNEARERLSLPPEDETKSQNLRSLQAMLAVVKMATDTGIDLKTAAGLVGLDIPEQAPKPAPPQFGGPPEAAPEEEAAIVPMKALDMEKWQHKALKSLRRFHKADVAFESDAIPLPEQERIHAALKAADSVEAVKAAFKDQGIVDRIIAAGGLEGDEIKVWRHKDTKKWAVSIGDWASDVTTAAIHKVLGDDVEIDAEWVPGDGYEAVKAAFKKRDAMDTLLDDVDEDARAWAEEATE